jgi:hypothetical protein
MPARPVLPVIAGLVLVLLAVAPPATADTTVHADLVQQNDSGVAGTVTLTARDNGDLHVEVTATGLMPGPHAQHIHGSADGAAFECATESQDADGNGWLTNEEASGEYGTVFLSLTTTGDTGAESGLTLDRMPVADERGSMTYERTIPAAAIPEGLEKGLQHMHVVQHGIDVNGNGEYDLDALGESTFAKGLGIPGVPEEATAPAACGMVMGAAAGQMPHGGVETGGGTAIPGDALRLAAFGVAMLSLAVGLEVRRRRNRGSARAG